MRILLLCLGLLACFDAEPDDRSVAPVADPADEVMAADPGVAEDATGGAAAPERAEKTAAGPDRGAKKRKRSSSAGKAAKGSRSARAGSTAGARPARASSPAPKPVADREPEPEPDMVPEPTPEPDPAEAWLATLRDSAITYNRPDTVPFGQVFDVQLFIDISGDTAATEAALDEAREANEHITGDTHTALAPTGDEVEVTLLGSNAQIDALEPDRQRLSSRARGQWQWRITPTSPDDIVLKLHVLAIQPGHASGLRIQSYEDTIVVKVTTAQRAQIWLSDNWEWAWTFFVAPIGGFVWARMRRRRKQRAPPSGDSEA